MIREHLQLLTKDDAKRKHIFLQDVTLDMGRRCRVQWDNKTQTDMIIEGERGYGVSQNTSHLFRGVVASGRREVGGQETRQRRWAWTYKSVILLAVIHLICC